MNPVSRDTTFAETLDDDRLTTLAARARLKIACLKHQIKRSLPKINGT